MNSFFRSFFAAILALTLFTFVFAGGIYAWLNHLTSSKRPETGKNGILFLDLGQVFHEQMQENPLANIVEEEQYDQPGVYDLIRLIQYSAIDSSIKGLYLKCNDNPNGFAVSEEIRDALLDFRKTGKFIYAFGDIIPQKAYYIGNIADKIYCNPKGTVDWRGLAAEMSFFKGTLEKLEIDPQIFYAGKFKSATEPFREDKMSGPNRIQLSELLSEFYNRLLLHTAQARGLDTGVLRKCVDEHLIRFGADALKYKLVDGLKYDDEVKDEIRGRLKIGRFDKINFVSIGKYAKAVEFRKTGNDRIALIYAEGEIVSGKGDQLQIGGDTYRGYLRKARVDKDIKAIVIRINSGGGSSLVSENLWREMALARAEKPVIVSFGDVAASGAYYLSCNADSIFAQPNSITGSIGVFSILPNMQQFFKDKLGVTFDVVKTAPDADELTITKPLTPQQKRFFQDEVDSIYHDFRIRVADGRKKTEAYIDSIGQGRVWSGQKAIELGLVDHLGGIQDAINCAVSMAGLNSYRIKEYPEPKNFLELLFNNYHRSIQAQSVKEELGADGYRIFNDIKKVRSMVGITQARLPFEFTIE
jgi:protease IV